MTTYEIIMVFLGNVKFYAFLLHTIFLFKFIFYHNKYINAIVPTHKTYQDPAHCPVWKGKDISNQESPEVK